MSPETYKICPADGGAGVQDFRCFSGGYFDTDTLSGALNVPRGISALHHPEGSLDDIFNLGGRVVFEYCLYGLIDIGAAESKHCQGPCGLFDGFVARGLEKGSCIDSFALDNLVLEL